MEDVIGGYSHPPDLHIQHRALLPDDLTHPHRDLPTQHRIAITS